MFQYHYTGFNVEKLSSTHHKTQLSRDPTVSPCTPHNTLTPACLFSQVHVRTTTHLSLSRGALISKGTHHHTPLYHGPLAFPVAHHNILTPLSPCTTFPRNTSQHTYPHFTVCQSCQIIVVPSLNHLLRDRILCSGAPCLDQGQIEMEKPSISKLFVMKPS